MPQHPTALAALAALLLAAPVRATEGEPDDVAEAPIAAALASLSEDVRVYNDHLVTLASPFMEGRVPGSRGMEIAKEYCEFWLRDAGLEAPFTAADEGAPTFRQPFPLSGIAELVSQSLALAGGEAFAADEDYTAMALGATSAVRGPVVFVGYSIPEGPEGTDYASYTESDDLTGKIALLLRFEPMDAEGKSRWSDTGPWTARASFDRKVRAAAERGAAGIVIVNTPGADDPRAGRLISFSGGGRSGVDVPVFMVMPDAAERIVAAGDPLGRSLLDLRELADEGRAMVELGCELELDCEISRKDLMGENVGGLLRGRGDLADEVVVIGAHLDHLGLGFFGSRDAENAGRELHPGADDNASGSAGVLMLADKLAADYAATPEDQPLRSVLFMLFSGEESGLNGSRHYVDNPIAPLEQHALMMNFDMIGRIVNDRLSVSGHGTAAGMEEWLTPIYEASDLEVVAQSSGGGGSDHLAFQMRSVPVLFGIIADFHADYHTPADTSDKINRVGAVQATLLWHDIALAAAQRTEAFEFVAPVRASGGGPGRGDIKVRFGIMPGNYEAEGGVLVSGVTQGGAADFAGVQKDDLLVTWDGADITDVRAWMGMLAKHEPGDKVQVGVLRGGEEVLLWVTLKPRDDAGR